MRFFSCLFGFAALMLCMPQAALCAESTTGPAFHTALWVVPFAGMLLSIALCPMLCPHSWEKHHGKIAVAWGLAFLIPCAATFGAEAAAGMAWHALALEYMPFVILLFALFTVAGGIRLTGSLTGTPAVNTLLLLIGTVLASWMGTTGAAMLLIRPLIRANAHRRYRAHSVIFFIFLVANIGGVLTPLGDPPLFLGFLKGVSFFWTLHHLFEPFLVMASVLLVIFFVLDSILYAREGKPTMQHDGTKLGVEGKINFVLLAGIIAAVLVSGSWRPGGITVFHAPIAWQNLARDAVLVLIALLSLALTSKQTRAMNDFSWGPMLEVGKLFFGIFLSMIPAIAMLQAGEHGPLAGVIHVVTDSRGEPVNTMYFWLTGILSSFLDNAPTYSVFFNTAGGDAAHLMHDLAPTLTAISAGAVFMGANTYIGNAPNFMVRSIAEHQGVRMPGFFGYMAWSICILIPCFLLLTWLFFV